MKTNRIFTVFRLLALGMLVAGFHAKAANVLTFKGKFTLASATRWGQVMLPAGDYSFTLDNDYDQPEVTVYRGTQSVARIPVTSISYIETGRSAMAMVLQGGSIREVNLPEIGVSLHFAAPSSGH